VQSASASEGAARETRQAKTGAIEMGHSRGWTAVGVRGSTALASGRVAPDEVEERTGGSGEGSKVYLFNCECHTFEEVIAQLLKAVPGMTRPLAEELAWRVHTTGLAEVYRGGSSDCDRVAKVLGETGLIVQVL
jgi:ATP-dependent Clp protease adaptor protein ClpS